MSGEVFEMARGTDARPTRNVRVNLLGGFEVAIDGRAVPVTGWGRRHAAALVKVLALSHGHRLHREQVIDTVWPDDSVEQALPKLHKAAHFARRATNIADAVAVRDLVPQDRYAPWAENRREQLRLRRLDLLRLSGRWAGVLELEHTDEAEPKCCGPTPGR